MSSPYMEMIDLPGLVENLILSLEDETNKYSELIDVLQKKNRCIVKGDVKELTSITFDEQVKVNAIQKTEKKRMQIIKDMSIVLNKKEDDLTIKFILDLISKQPNDAKKLDEVTKKLRVVLSDVKKINDQNALLIRQSLDYINYSVNLIQSSNHAEPPDYPSKYQNRNNASFFDAKQ